jgi:hypothetical protein
VHLHFLGTSRLIFGAREWKLEADDEIFIEAPGPSPSLVNHIEDRRIRIEEAIVVSRA